MRKRDFFISYTQADKTEAEWIAETLRKNGYTVYIQEDDIASGENFLGKIHEYMESSRSFIAVWSKSYFKSKWAMSEFTNAYVANINHRWAEFIPVKVQKCNLPKVFAATNYIDLFDVDNPEKEKQLLNAIKRKPWSILKIIGIIILCLLVISCYYYSE